MCPDCKGHTGMLRPNSCLGAHGLGQGREKTGPLAAELGCEVCSPGLAVGCSRIAQGQGYWKGCAGVGVRDLGVLGTLEKKKMSILVKGI